MDVDVVVAGAGAVATHNDATNKTSKACNKSANMAANKTMQWPPFVIQVASNKWDIDLMSRI